MQTEIWKDVIDYEGIYQVSNLGRVKRIYNNKNIKEKILKLLPRPDNSSFSVGLYKNKTVKNRTVSILLASTFLKNSKYDSSLKIKFKDGDKLNNTLNNLEIVVETERIIKKRQEFIGTVIGKVKIISLHSVKRGNNRNIYHYKYECICGNTDIAPKSSLLTSKKSRNTYCCTKCRKDKLVEWAKTACIRYTDPVEAKCSTLFSNYRSKSKKKNWEFNLTFEQFKNLVRSNCHYCNLEPNKCRKDISKSRLGVSRIFFNGVDRIDSSKGYSINNTVPCCEDCNKAKRNLSYNQFLELIERIYKFKIKNNEEKIN